MLTYSDIEGESTIDKWNEEENEPLAQLWENCYDIMELIVKALNRALRYQKVLSVKKLKLKEEQECIDLLSKIASGLENLDFEQGMLRLQSVVFSTEEEDSIECAVDFLVDITRGTMRDVTLLIQESFDLLLTSWKLNNKCL